MVRRVERMALLKGSSSWEWKASGGGGGGGAQRQEVVEKGRWAEGIRGCWRVSVRRCAWGNLIVEGGCARERSDDACKALV